MMIGSLIIEYVSMRYFSSQGIDIYSLNFVHLHLFIYLHKFIVTTILYHRTFLGRLLQFESLGYIAPPHNPTDINTRFNINQILN